MLVIGIVYHVQFMIGLRSEREAMKAAGLIHGESHFPPSLTLITAVVLLAHRRGGHREHGFSGRTVRLRRRQPVHFNRLHVQGVDTWPTA